MYIPSIAKTYMQPRCGCSLLNIEVGSAVTNLQVESTVRTYYVHIFSLSLCAVSSVGLQCALVSRETPNCENFLYQPATVQLQ